MSAAQANPTISPETIDRITEQVVSRSGTLSVGLSDHTTAPPFPAIQMAPLEFAPVLEAPRRLANHPRLAAALLNTPWLIQSGWLEALYAIADGAMVDLSSMPGAARSEAWRRGDVLALERQPGTRLPGSRFTTVRDGIATIHVNGPIIRYADMFSEMSGATSLDSISSDFHRALGDQSVKGILLNIDSPGGEAAGIDEFAAMVAAARDTKPIHAYVGDLMASAAYWIGSAASQITAARTASLGSIGTVAIMPRKDSEGYIEIVSSQSPKKRLDPETDAGAAEVQAHVDQLTEIFIESVASYRDTEVKTVEEDFGQGGLLVGKRAVKAGLADQIGSYESAFRALVRETERTRKTMANETIEPQVQADAAVPQIDASALTDLQARLKAMEEQNAALLSEKAEMQTRALRDRLLATIKTEGWLGADEDNLTVALAIVESCGGEDGAVYQAFARSMSAAANTEALASLAEPVGVGGVEVTQGVIGELQVKAAALQAVNPKLTIEQAQNEVFSADRDLESRYSAHIAKLGGRR